MSFPLDELQMLAARHGRVARLLVADAHGSTPREAGAQMLVWQGGESGTIGGGALERDAMEAARRSLAGTGWVRRVALGPDLGQCCGGAATLVVEIFDTRRLAGIGPGHFLRRLSGNTEPPLAMRKQIAKARNSGAAVHMQYADGWLIEPLATRQRDIWLYGAGHVGRAVVQVLAALPGLRITWVDTAPDRFPADMPENVAPLVARNPADAVAHAPRNAEHLIFTYSHAFDLEICSRLLHHGFANTGLIGSKTKWARFRKRLLALGHSAEAIARITCPIGDPALGKHPQAIAVGVAARLLLAPGETRQCGREAG